MKSAGDVDSVVNAAPDPAGEKSLWSQIMDQINYIFFNRSPSLGWGLYQPAGVEKSVRGVSYGQANSPFAPTYSLASDGRYGHVDINPTTGEFWYTPDPGVRVSGITDSFTIAVDNGTAAQLPGVLGMVQRALHSLAIAIGISQKDGAERIVNVTIPGTGVYGDVANTIYYERQGSASNCTLMATAMALGIAKRSFEAMPTPAELINLAMTNQSVAFPGRKMYLDEFIAEGVSPIDATVLMERYFDVTATHSRYGKWDSNVGAYTGATLEDGQIAFRDLQAALSEGSAVMVNYNAFTVWTAAAGYQPRDRPNFLVPNHMATVVSVDMNTGIVTVNDSSAPKGQGLQVPLGAFMNAWQSSGYEAVVVTDNATVPAEGQVDVA
jgi:hypothetical protein